MSEKQKRTVGKRTVFYGIVVLIVVGGVLFGISVHKRSGLAGNADKIAVKSETVSKGNISNTVEGSGSIEVANTVNVTVPTGIKVKKVLVESGDMVKKGQTLATLEANSIISALAEIEESIDLVDASLEEDGLSALQKKKLKGDREELKSSRKVLKKLSKNPALVANSDGVIESVNVSEGSETSKSSGSSSSSQSSASQGISNMSIKSSASQGIANNYSSGNMSATLMNYSASEPQNLQETVIYDFKDLVVAKPKTAATQKPISTAGKSSKTGNQTGNGSSLSKQNANGDSSMYSSGSQTTAKSDGDLSSTVTSTKTDSVSSNDTSIYSDSKSIAFTIQKQDSVKVSLNVDELDILSVKRGQYVSITLDAIEDKEFEGTITKVADTASASDGNAKYEVEIILKKDADMRIGMTASATINVSEVNDVLAIPMNALQQKGDKTFVYTKQDDDGNLSGEVTVETGLSDGQKVEIKSGLSEGDTVYYTRTGDSDSKMSDMERGNMPGGNFGGFQKGSGNFQGGHGDRPSKQYSE